MPNKHYTHNDIIGNNLELTDIVAFSDKNQLNIGIVKKLNPKKITITSIHQTRAREHQRYPLDLVKINKDDALIFILKHQGVT